LPTDRLQRARSAGTPDEGPFVVVAKIDNALRLTAVDRKAAQMNLRAGMPLADARAMIPSLKAVDADDAADRKLLERAREVADRLVDYEGPLNDEIDRFFAGAEVDSLA